MCGNGDHLPATDRAEGLDRDFDLSSIRRLRDEVRACGIAYGLADLRLAKFVLAVNEVATNAVHHGGGRGHLHLSRDGSDLWCRITDQGPGFPQQRRTRQSRPPPVSAVEDLSGGYGLWLVQQVCTEVRIASTAHGTEVVLRYSLSAG
ncbi:ATP-binding protein [Couchioplanes caeruleus]|uniref:Histidine kinase/HSP90-like ATPase domain-containing protein n=2 Tax=Couchioplanes caeruleus TaxID=56438 RepID=A0A1K0GPI2_9ACTN|nr:ATP-binding protein [Couchioplanes caeruleus]OJF14286.1 hypothetical protein BG844_10585 [Couchioplanes caeruleus subsp. caeruleus]ROP31612.1 anti-sigma regulatory factor (Ser/Thr protein kinase) [Couchioplanes caeruleus]